MAEDYILNVVDKTSKLDWAFPFQRTGAFPLDRSSLFSSYNDAVLYASGGEDERGLSGSSYVGQPISVYDAETASVTLYVIQTDRSLKEVGSVPIGDNLSIEVKDGIIQLKDFGKNYYAYVPAVKDDKGNITEASKYILTEGFKAGLEPRVVSAGDSLAIAWYEPGTETVEDVAANIESVSKTVDSLDQTLNREGGLIDQVDNLKVQVGTAADGTGSGATGLYAEIERIDEELANKPNANDVTRQIAEAVAGADHLKREIVGALPEISQADPNVIYMVPTGLPEGDNKYYEWILIDGIFEPVGSWEVDLSEYAKTSDVETALNKKVDKVEGSRLITNEEIEKLSGIEVGAQVNVINSVSSDFTISENKELQLNTIGQDKISGLSDILNTKVDKKTSTISNVDGSTSEVEWTLLSPEDKSKLDSIDESAEPNYIKAVEEEFTVTNGTLGIKQIPINKITDLNDQLNVIQSNILSLDEIINGKTTEEGQVVQGVVAKLGDLTTTVNNLSNNLVNYVTVEDFNAVVGNLEEMKTSNINVMEDINGIKEILSWKDI